MNAATLKECPFCGSAAMLEDHRTIWRVACASLECGAQVLGDRAPEPDGSESIAYWADLQDTAIDRWNARHIAPPVAAGSVDTPTWTSEAISCAYLPGAKQFVELEIHQQLVDDALAGQLAVFKKAGDVDQAEFNRKWLEQKERAEKAEAELAQVNQWYRTAHQISEDLAARILKADDRIEELETEIKVLHRG